MSNTLRLKAHFGIGRFLACLHQCVRSRGKKFAEGPPLGRKADVANVTKWWAELPDVMGCPRARDRVTFRPFRKKELAQSAVFRLRCRAGSFMRCQALCVAKLDRVGRRAADVLKLRDDSRLWVVFADSPKARPLQLGILAVVAEEEGPRHNHPAPVPTGLGCGPPGGASVLTRKDKSSDSALGVSCFFRSKPKTRSNRSADERPRIADLFRFQTEASKRSRCVCYPATVVFLP